RRAAEALDRGTHFRLAQSLASSVQRLRTHDREFQSLCSSSDDSSNGPASIKFRLFGHALRKSRELSRKATQRSDSYDFFFLAMTHHKLGHKEEARNLYDRGVQWMDKNRPCDVDERLFRREAAQLLGLEPPESEPVPELVPAPKVCIE